MSHHPTTGAPGRRWHATRAASVLAGLSLAAFTVPFLATEASAAQPTVDPALVGLYGSADPTYDGVFRQSLGILGILAAGEQPADEAVQWLLDQQCSDGGFMSFNPDPQAACVAPDPVNFAGEDTNSTALAVQALVGVGATDEAEAAAQFLDDARNTDGGWPYIPGGDSDPNSTGLALMATSTRGAAVDQDAVDYVAGMQVGCTGAAADRGGITSAFSGGAPDLLSTVQAVPGLAGLSLLTGPAATTPWADDAPAFPCPVDTTDGETVAGWGSAWLEGQMAADAVGGGNAAWAVLAFVSTRTGHDEAAALYADIVSDLGPAPATTKQKGATAALATQTDENPGALGLAALTGTTLGEDVSGFAARVAATMTAAPASSPSPTPEPSPSDGAAAGSDDPTLPATGTDPLLVLTGTTLVLAGSGLVLGTRRRGRGGRRA